MTPTQRHLRLTALLLPLAQRRHHDQDLGIRANYAALKAFLDALDEDDFRFLARHLLLWSTPSREEATRRITMRPGLVAALEALAEQLGRDINTSRVAARVPGRRR